MKLVNQFKIKVSLLVVMIFINILSTITYIGYMYYTERQLYLSMIDKQLVATAHGFKSTVEHYQERLFSSDQKKQQLEFSKMINEANLFSQNTGATYITSYLLKDNKPILISESASPEEVKKGSYRKLYEVVTDNEGLLQSLTDKKHFFTEYSDPFGSYRSIAYYTQNEKGMPYSIVVDISQDDIQAFLTKSLLTTAGFGFLFCMLGIGMSIIFAKALTDPINHLCSDIAKIAQGDLKVTIQYDAENELGYLARQVNYMAHELRMLIQNVKYSSDKVFSTVESLKQKSRGTQLGSIEQSDRTTQITVNAEQLSHGISGIAKNAKTLSVEARHSIDLADEGRTMVEKTIKTVSSVQNATLMLGTQIETLNHRVEEVGKIAELIREIADQTNLLALNASIESARAGEQGKGFAIVADEIRKLAEKTLKATNQISEQISSVQTESTETAVMMEESSNQVQEATTNIESLIKTIDTMVEGFRVISFQVREIADSVSQQSIASENIALNTELTSHIAERIQLSSNDVVENLNTLHSVANELKDASASFKV